MVLNPERLHESIVLVGKEAFTHYYHDLSFRTSICISLFTVGLFFSLFVPLMPVLMTIIFTIIYYVDKYNLMYYYPLEFEPQSVSRKLIIKNSFFAVLVFQAGTIILGLWKADVREDGTEETFIAGKTAIYMFSLVFIELVILLTVFEFMRRPWEGVELEIEKALELQ